MSVAWLQPAALAGLLLVAVPILLHLLARPEVRPRPFPSLRFLRETRLSSLTRRAIHDWPLLLVRCLIVAAAAAALAAPVLLTGARERAWAGRAARAVVIEPGVGPADAAAVADAAFRSTVIGRARLTDGVAAAVSWLDLQPPASREVVVVSPFRRGTIDETTFHDVPAHVGLRFVRLPAPDKSVPTLGVLRVGDGGLERVPLALELTSDATGVTEGEAEPIDGARPPLAVEASADLQEAADRTLAAVLADGVLLPRADRRVLVTWNGSVQPGDVAVSTPWMRRAVERLPGVGAREEPGRLVIGLDGRPGDLDAATRLRAVVEAAFSDSFDDLEPAVIPDARLGEWSRPSGGVPPDTEPGDEGDRRWLWGLVLALLAVEQWLRRTPRTSDAGAQPDVEERGVA